MEISKDISVTIQCDKIFCDDHKECPFVCQTASPTDRCKLFSEPLKCEYEKGRRWRHFRCSKCIETFGGE